MGKEYDIAKVTGRCCECGKDMGPGEELVACVIEAGEELRRRDYCTECFDAGEREGGPDMLGQWRMRIPEPQARRKLFIDDDLLLDFFRRLEGATEPGKVNFRFVLTLLLMRKKLLVYEHSERDEQGSDVWTLRVRGADERSKVIDPHMDDEKTSAVSRQLGEILESEV